MKIPDFFKEAFYVNLDYRTDRRLQFESEMKLYNLDNYIQRYPACLPKLDDVKEDDIALMGYRKLGACGRSHRNIVQYAKDKDLDNILIFEDDAVFYNDGPEPAIDLIEKALDILATIPDWDLFFMGGIICTPDIEQPVNTLLKVDNILTTHAWAINKKCYDEVLRYRPGDGYEEEFDSPLDGGLGNHPRLNKYLVYPLAIYQRSNVLSDCATAGDRFAITGPVDPWLANYNKPIRK
jgi:hypothetical protein